MGIGHVPEGKKLFLEMNIRDNLLTGAYLRRDKELIEQDLQKVYKYFPVLANSATKLASKMSGGEQQMIAIGRGLMCAPKLLLLDEPSLGLSPIMTREVGSIIKRIADEGMSILLIEQNANLAFQLAKKCYVLETGKIAIEGSSRELQNNQHVKEAYLGISCIMPAAGTPGTNNAEKTREQPAKEPERIDTAKRSAVKEAVLEPYSQLSSFPAAEQAKEKIRRGTGEPNKVLPDTWPQKKRAGNGSGYAVDTGAGVSSGSGGPLAATPGGFAGLSLRKGQEQLSKVVKKVFAPVKR
jgi:ABC-type multidrug transport system ATPase subunit